VAAWRHRAALQLRPAWRASQSACTHAGGRHGEPRRRGRRAHVDRPRVEHRRRVLGGSWRRADPWGPRAHPPEHLVRHLADHGVRPSLRKRHHARHRGGGIQRRCYGLRRGRRVDRSRWHPVLRGVHHAEQQGNLEDWGCAAHSEQEQLLHRARRQARRRHRCFGATLRQRVLNDHWRHPTLPVRALPERRQNYRRRDRCRRQRDRRRSGTSR